ncbi:MAG: serine hydrolase domain-containing protein [Alphaproteobacteria bacterium]
MPFPLETADPAAVRLDPVAIGRLVALIERHIAEGRYPGAQIAFARDGRLALHRSFGHARIGAAPADARDDTLWLLFSNTKVVTACAVWVLVDRGALRFADAVADHVPEFARNGKACITVHDVLTHQAGFPNAAMPEAAWDDHELMRRTVCDYTLDWTPGSRVHYHAAAAHWTAAVLIEALTGRDFRDFIREEVIEPLGLGGELFVGLPDVEHGRAADIHEPDTDGRHAIIADRNSPAAKRAGIPGGGGFATARAMAAFYQMLLAGGRLNGRRIVSARMVDWVTRNHTGERLDENFAMPMHRGLGPHVRGTTPTIRGLGTIAGPRAYGHGGVGSSYCWADPDSGVSFAYLSNSRIPEPWHSIRMDLVSNLAHAAIER